MPAPLPQFIVDYIVQQLALGNTKPAVIEAVYKKYGRRPNPATIIRIKKRYKESIVGAHDVIASRAEIIGADVLKQKAYRMMNRKLDRALTDDSEIDRLRLRLKAGEIDRKGFDAEMTRYEVLTINELTKISDSMNKADQKNETPAMTPEDQAALALMMQGIKAGNPFQLVQVLTRGPNAGTPAPQADTQPSAA